METIKCSKGRCWDTSSYAYRRICDEDDIICQTEADLVEEMI